MMGRGLLVAAFDFSTAHADEFHDWYDLEHIPERRAVPGFGACERWIGDEQPALSVATYDLDSVEVLRGKAYASIAYGNLSAWSKRVTAMCKRLVRFEGTQDRPRRRGGAGSEQRRAAAQCDERRAPPRRTTSTPGTTRSTSPRSPAFRAPWRRGATGRARRTQARIATSRSITLSRRTWRGARRGMPRSIRRGPPGCARISATASAS